MILLLMLRDPLTSMKGPLISCILFKFLFGISIESLVDIVLIKSLFKKKNLQSLFSVVFK